MALRWVLGLETAKRLGTAKGLETDLGWVKGMETAKERVKGMEMGLETDLVLVLNS